MQPLRIVVITGLSGSGKSTAIRALEDLDYFCVDNLPVLLLPRFIDLLESSGHGLTHMGLVIDARERRFLPEAEEIFNRIQLDGHHLEVVFLDTDDDTLVQRFSATRRKHPLAPTGNILDGIDAERQALDHLRQMADHVIDSSDLNVHELRRVVEELFDPEANGPRRLTLNLLSFGFKHGVPRGADLVFDVRFLTNPHFVPELRPRTGLDPEVSRFVLEQESTQTFLNHLLPMLDFLLPLYRAEGKAYLTLAIGCTGGQHRSVALAEHVAAHLADADLTLNVHHRDMPTTP